MSKQGRSKASFPGDYKEVSSFAI